MQISKEALDLKYQLQELCKVQNLCICGFFIALYVVLSFFNIPISSIVEIRIGFLAFIAAGMMEFVISITLTSTWLYLMYGTPLQVLLTTRIIKCTMNFFVNIVIIYVFLEAFQKVVRVALPARR